MAGESIENSEENDGKNIPEGEISVGVEKNRSLAVGALPCHQGQSTKERHRV
jgi:hypothetical protein